MERFYHIRVRRYGFATPLNNGGATVHLESIEGDPLHVRMRVAYCNPTDVFCKKEGREQCLGRPERSLMLPHSESHAELRVYPAIEPKEPKVIALREIPSELGHIWKTVHKRAHEKIDRNFAPEFDHRIREWLPRT